jgi:hypothetical protein
MVPNNNLFLMIIMVCLIGYVYAQYSNIKSIEGFIGMPQTRPVVDVIGQNGLSVSGNNQSQLYPPTYVVPGTYQSPLPPRFSSTGYGGNIYYNLPEKRNLAVDPNDPMLLAGKIQKPSIREPFQYATGSPPAQSEKAYNDLKQDDSTLFSNQLPVAPMNNVGAGGSEVPVVMDRFIYANLRSRLIGRADPIRGDLPIVPILSQSDPNSPIMFRTSVNPSIDLQSGAMAVLGGAYNENVRDTVQLQMQAAGGAVNTFAGTAWQPPVNTPVGREIANINMATGRNVESSQASNFGDYITTSFP